MNGSIGAKMRSTRSTYCVSSGVLAPNSELMSPGNRIIMPTTTIRLNKSHLTALETSMRRPIKSCCPRRNPPMVRVAEPTPPENIMPMDSRLMHTDTVNMPFAPCLSWMMLFMSRNIAVNIKLLIISGVPCRVFSFRLFQSDLVKGLMRNEH